jgi:uncharacterized protein YggE
MGKPDSITVVARHREEVRARQADIFFTAMAASLYTGEVALKKAKELAQIVGLLTAAGLDTTHIHLRGIQAERSSPNIGRESAAIYLLRVHCPDLDILPEILGVLTPQRSISMDHLEWQFADDRTVRAKWLDGCLTEAREKAKRIAAGLGVKVLGVHSFKETWTEPPEDQTRVLFVPGRGAASTIKSGSDRPGDMRFPLVITKEVLLSVEVEFRVSPLGGAA